MMCQYEVNQAVYSIICKIYWKIYCCLVIFLLLKRPVVLMAKFFVWDDRNPHGPMK